MVGIFLAFVCADFVAPFPVAAINELTDGRVAPHDGTTTTSFQFTVTFSSSPNRRALTVEAQVAGLRVPLTLISGTETDGKWRGFSLLPEGDDWPVTFVADAESGSDPTTSGPSLNVTAAPVTPSPQPTPTASPSPTPTGAPSGSPASSPTVPPGGSPPSQPTPAASPVGPAPTPTPTTGSGLSPGGTSSATPVWGAFAGGAIEQATPSEVAALTPSEPAPREARQGGSLAALPIISGGLVAFGLLGIAGVLAVQRDRRRRWLHDRLARAVESGKRERPRRRWVTRA